MIGGNDVEVITAPAAGQRIVNPKAIAAMKELGYDLSLHDSKSLDEVKRFAPFDAVQVTMGCGDACPGYPAKQFIDWQIPDPKHMEPQQFNEVQGFYPGKSGRTVESLELVLKLKGIKRSAWFFLSFRKNKKRLI